MNFVRSALISIAMLGAFSTSQAMAGEFTPYLPPPGGGSVEFNFVHQNSQTGLFAQGSARPWQRFEQNAYQLSGNYGVSDKLAIDARITYSDTDFVPNGNGPASGQNGLSDTQIGLRYRLLDELENSPVTLTLGLSGILRGLYTPTSIDTLGEGGSGAQFGVSIGKLVTKKLALVAEIGGRARLNSVPEEFFYSAEAAYAFHPRFSAWAGVTVSNSVGGVDIGTSGFAARGFPALNEDVKLWQVGGDLALTKKISLTGSYGRKFAGRNTVEGPFFRTGLRFSF